MNSSPFLQITGFLGAGKTRLCRALKAQGFEAIMEVNGLSAPAGGAGSGAVIGVVDAANLDYQLRDPLIGPLIEKQMQVADLLYVSKLDLVELSQVQSELSSHTETPLLAELDELFDAVRTIEHNADRPSIASTFIDLSNEFTTWSFVGPVRLASGRVENAVRTRPQGAYRLSAEIRTEANGLSVELVGRVREILPIAEPEETKIVAIGAKRLFNPALMAAWWAHEVADSGYTLGIFNSR